MGWDRKGNGVASIAPFAGRFTIFKESSRLPEDPAAGAGAGPTEEQDEIKNPAIRASVSADEGGGRRGEDLKIQDPGATYRRAGG